MSAPVAVIADVHGNSWALDAVLADARARAARTFLDLGDCLDGPLDPAGTADRLLRPEHLDWATGFPTAAEHEDIVLLHATPHDVDLDQVARAAHVTRHTWSAASTPSSASLRWPTCGSGGWQSVSIC